MAIKFIGDIDVTGNMNITASDVPSLDASKISSGAFSTARIPNLSASKITSGVFSSARIPTMTWTPTVYLFQTAQTYTSSNASINLQSGASISGTTGITQTNNRLAFDEGGTYLISWSITWENEVANRNNFGASAKINGTVVQGGTDIQYFRYNTYGHKSTTSTTFAVSVSANDNLEFFTFLQSGTANHKVTSTNGDGGAITIVRLS